MEIFAAYDWKPFQSCFSITNDFRIFDIAIVYPVSYYLAKSATADGLTSSDSIDKKGREI
jgi:hypothetical protein